MRADPHPMNDERLKTLREYNILDTVPEDDFSQITDLVSDLCDMPIALISFVDDYRQWFKAAKGFDQTETPIEQAICAHAILRDDLLEIPDTHADPRTADNPVCMGPDGARFYAGQPMIAPNGMAIGTLCVLDTKPRTLTDLQRKTLRVMSRQVMKQLALRVALEAQSVLQSEADHRVKNSLQSMSSIVRVYTRTVTDDAAREALSAIQRRIDAVGALHEELQGDHGSGVVDASAYLGRVMHLLQDSAPENISFRTTFDPILMRSDRAANVAMIISEFVANSIKHAFPDGMAGEISVQLKVVESGQYRLECADNGVGQASQTAGGSDSTGIGMSLVSAAVSNLGGKRNDSLTSDGSKLVLEFGEYVQSPDDASAPKRRERG